MDESLTSEKYKKRSSIKFERFKEISSLVLYISCVGICQNLFISISYIFIGQTYGDKDMINALGIAFSLFNVTSLSIFFWFIAAFQMICSKALAAHQYENFSKYMQKLRQLMFFFTLFMSILNVYVGPYFCKINSVDDTILNYFNQYIYIQGIFTMIYGQLQLSIVYFNIIEKPIYNLINSLVTFAFHPVFCYIFIVWMRLGVIGFGLSLIFSSLLFLVLNSYSVFKYDTNHEIDHLKRLLIFDGQNGPIWDTLPVAVIEWIDSMGFELQIFISILLDKDSFTVSVIFFNLIFLLNSIIEANSMAACILILKKITNNSAEESKKFIIEVLIYLSVLCIVILLILLYINTDLIRYYINDEGVFDIGKRNYYFLPVIYFLDFYMYVLGSILRSLGLYKKVTLSLFFVFLCFGLSFSYVISITYGMGIFGVMFSICVSLTILNVIWVFLLVTANIEEVKAEILLSMSEDEQYQLIENKE